MKYFNVGELKKALNNIDDKTFIAVGKRENNEIDEIENESGIVEARMKTIGFDSSSSNERYLKLYLNDFNESGCLRFR